MVFDLALTFVNNVGPILARKLVAYCGGTAEAVFKQRKEAIAKIPGIGRNVINALKSNAPLLRAEEEIKLAEKNGIKIFLFSDKSYPQKLKHCIDAPYLIYSKGNMNLNEEKILSIVGTRKASAVGLEVCKKIVEELKDSNILIVSGLAYGVDICAHKTAIASNLQTVGVLAHGLDRVYPSLHANSVKKMRDNGGVISEFPTGSNPDRENFPKRNRIIAGLADATLVVETGLKGGAMITARIANSYNRDVLAIPGDVCSSTSRGCNFLIKNNEAALVENAQDVLNYMNWDIAKRKDNLQVSLFIDLTIEENQVVEIIRGEGTIHIDKLCFELKTPLSKVAPILLNLELKGVLKSLPGKLVQLI